MENKPFPQAVEYRGTKAVIYLQKQGTKERFEVRYFDVDGSKQRTTFPSLNMAQTFADAAVRELVKSRGDFLTLRGAEAHGYTKAVDLLAPMGLNVEQSANITVQCQQVLGGQGSIVDAVRYYVENRPKKSPEITVQQVVDELLDLKRREASIGSLHERDLRNRLGKFAAYFRCPIRQVKPEDIRDYLLNLPVSERTRHNMRTTIAGLFNYAKQEGYLPADHKGVPRPTKRRRVKLAVAVFTPEEMRKLLNAASGQQLAALALQGFAGIRAEEVKRLSWEHVNFSEGHIVIPDAVAKCEERRLVPLTDNLAAWLKPIAKTSGPVCLFTNLANVYEHMRKRAGVEWKRNGLRHSFVSYRLAIAKNVPQVAFEAGNSPTMVQRHYLKVVSETMAKAWFDLKPQTETTATGGKD
jgi:integrase